MILSATEQLQLLLQNPVFIGCVSSWFCAQFIKTLIKLCSGKVHSIEELFELLIWRTGGMPSSHTALVACLSTSIAFRSGLDSDLFILSFCFFMVTIRDAVGVRRSSGNQAKALNEMGSELKKSGIWEAFKKVKEVQGHTPLEVFVGSLLGFFIGVAFSVL